MFKSLSPLLAIILLSLSACGGSSSSSTPIASSVSTSSGSGDNGDALPDDILTGTYTYSDADGDTEASTSFRWLRDGAAINGATASTYTVTYADKGASISFEVTPVSNAVSGTAVASSGVDARLAIFDTFQAADVVIGQVDFTGILGNQGGAADANTISSNGGNPIIVNNILYINEYGNDRVLGFNSVPTINNIYADFVLGQPDFTTTTVGTSAIKFTGVDGMAFDNDKLFVNSYDNQRTLIWNSIPTSGNVPADVVIGSVDLDTPGVGGCNNKEIGYPEGLWAANGKLIITDTGHSRVLIWNTIPTTDHTPADLVLGQLDFTHCAANDVNGDGASETDPTSQTLNNPKGAWSDGTRLVVMDSINKRVLIWNTFPTTSTQAADLVLGQSNFIHNTANDDNQDDIADTDPTNRTLYTATLGVFSNGTQLFIADTLNHRVMIWNTFPTSNFQSADVVLGQSDFTHNTKNDDNQDDADDSVATARTLSGPAGVYQSGKQLIINDRSNNRVLIYNGH